MKKLFYLLMFFWVPVLAQNTVTLPSGASPTTPSYRYITPSGKPDSLKQYWVYNPSTSTYNRGITFTEFNHYVGTATATAIAAGGGKLKTTITVLQQPTIGTVLLAGTSLDSVMTALYAPPQPPLASLSGSQAWEFTSASTQSATLSYSYSKQTGTQNFATNGATLNGSASGITQNVNGASGTISVTFPTNTNNGYTFAATTITPLTAYAAATQNYYPKIYVGTCAGTTPTSGEILAATTQQLYSQLAYNMNFTFTGTNLHVFYVYWGSYGTISSVKDVAGNQLIGACTLSSFSFTNSLGFTDTFKAVTTNNVYTNANIVLTLQ